ncbi:MAG: SusD/RagB family nutrient-binding outer membrane lipoprotein [Prevotellaceae bacterium]|jgi:hypothetical protein|nr:SusD/RagB family nutrient-binding outer membrane lipoprotein [Prevotellaceae bacterium]
MKKINKLGISLLMTLMFVSCMNLDINTDSDSLSSSSGNLATRLPGMQFWMGHTHQTTGFFTALINQQITLSNRGDRYGSLAEWTAANNTASTYPYQAFFVGAAGTFADVYAMAEKEGAYHYMGVIKLFRAMGFMVMCDVYGEMPYTNALGVNINPNYDDGKTIFNGALSELDEAIELFNKTQESDAHTLTEGDSWNGGDVDKWIRMCYGFKARWLNNLSKKSDLYDPAAILEALDNAPQSNADNTIINHEYSTGEVADNLWGDDIKTNYTYIWLLNWSRTYYVTKWYADLLTDFDGKGIVDPRADKLVPSAQIKGGTEWFRTPGVDMQSDIRMTPVGSTVSNWKGPALYDAATKKWTVTSTTDSTVISLQTKGIHSPNYRDVAEDGAILNTGTFYVRPDAPTHLLCYPEMCFIKAEVLFRQGQTAPAFDAYKEGIKAHIDLMNEKLAAGDANIAKKAITAAERDAYLNSAAIGTASDLTLGKIMMQKFIALSFSNQNWNDMRRMDYSPAIYHGWAEPYERTSGNNDKKWIPDGKQYRRLGYVSHEFNYNNDNLAASHPNALKDDIRSFPVWWDYPTDDYKTAN